MQVNPRCPLDQLPGVKLREDVPEGFIDGPVPAEEAHRGEEDEPQDGKTKVHTGHRVSYEVR